MPTLKEWIDSKTAEHKLGRSGAYSSGNINIVGRFTEDTTLGALHIASGTEYCIFRPLEMRGDKIVASIFQQDHIVNIYPGGTVRRRRISTMMDMV